LITTGGTIDKVYFDSKGGYEVGPPVAERILIDGRVVDTMPIVELFRKDSLELTEDDRVAIREAVVACGTPRVIITHGTDTMVETARALDRVFDKRVVLTGAIQPGGFSDSDASFNLGMAVAAVQVLPVGIYIVASGRVFPARNVHKNMELNRFEFLDPPGPQQ
jgi:L-asparaginase